jgi:YHS domain-containing protein
MLNICPACGLPVKEASAPYTSNYCGKTYYFHNLKEKKMFDKNPGLFIKKTT